jgi:large subunit ribosomal protein L15
MGWGQVGQHRASGHKKFGKEEGGKKIVDLVSAGYDKLLGGGKITNAYSVKVKQFTASAEEKLKAVGGEVLTNNG